jgi:hypothetical protein
MESVDWGDDSEAKFGLRDVLEMLALVAGFAALVTIGLGLSKLLG